MNLTVVKLQTSPSLILVPSRVDESFVNALEPSLAEAHSLLIRPGPEFSFDKARQKILRLAEVLPYSERLALEIPDDVLGGEGGRLLRMGGVIEWNKRVSVPNTLHTMLRIDRVCWSIDYVPQQACSTKSCG